ncbi:MAG TPA: TonB family protein [Longimicrobium sp.]|nr:TonB family protein [Longimicrobium sp.]
MFQVVAGERKRRVISPTTIAASVAAHVLLLGGALYAAAGDADPPDEVSTVIDIGPYDPPPPPAPVEPAPPPPQPDQPDQPAPTPGETLELPSPTEVPDDIAPEPPGVQPVDPAAYTGDGPIGDVIGPPPPEPTPPTGNPNPPPGPDYVPGELEVEERPVLNRDGLARALERHYPAVLRDSRVNGRVVIEVIVDEDGRVREGSARVVEASHPAFGEAALRAVDRFRFRPGRMAGVPVPVRVTIPIQWMVPN